MGLQNRKKIRVRCRIGAAPQSGNVCDNPLHLTRLPWNHESGDAAPRCRISTEMGFAVDWLDTLEIIAWEQDIDGQFYHVCAQPSGKKGKIILSFDVWQLSFDDGARFPLANSSVEGLLHWAADAVLSEPRAEGTELLVQGSGVVCFSANEFIRCLRSSALQKPTLLPHAALRLQLIDLVGLMSCAQETISRLDTVDHLALDPQACRSLLPLLRSGRCRMVNGRVDSQNPGGNEDSEITYLSESPLRCSNWLFGSTADSSPQLLEAVMASDAWKDSSSLPLLWTEEDSKVFLGDAGSGMRPHTDILWLPQLGFVLSGEKRLAIENWESVGGEWRGASTIIAKAGDMFAFNASLKHAALNAGTSPTAAMYQGFLPFAAVQRFCSTPPEPDNHVGRYDGTYEILRPSPHGRARGEISLIDKLQNLRNELTSQAEESTIAVLDQAAEALISAEVRLKPKSSN